MRYFKVEVQQAGVYQALPQRWELFIEARSRVEAVKAVSSRLRALVLRADEVRLVDIPEGEIIQEASL